VPIPFDLVVVVVGTLVAYLADFEGHFGIKIVGTMPTGFPAPEMPPLRLFPTLLPCMIEIAVVSFAVNISMGKLFAKKYNYEIAPNQELISYGIANIVCSFFMGFPGSVSLSRCAILDSTGARTQVYSFFGSVILLIVILFMGSCFRTLPEACLSAIIVMALRLLMQEVFTLPKIYKRSKLEALAWFVTFLCVVVFNVDIGLYIGIGFSLLLVIIRSQRAHASVLGNIPGTIIYESIDACQEVKEFTNIKIIRYEESIYYANVEHFKNRIMKLVGINPFDEIAEMAKRMKRSKQGPSSLISKLKDRLQSSAKSYTTNAPNNEDQDKVEKNTDLNKASFLPVFEIKHIIIDFSCINFIDTQGIHEVLQLHSGYKEIGIELHMTYIKQAVLRKFKSDLNHDKLDYNLIYPTTVDAVHHILKRIQEEKENIDQTAMISFKEQESSFIDHLDKGHSSIPNELNSAAYKLEEEDLDDYAMTSNK
jgi:MFS superfamily sulfate permease-like transporter